MPDATRAQAAENREEVPSPAVFESAFIERKVVELMRQLACGELEPRTWTLTFSPKVARELKPLFESQGDFVKLAEALRTRPYLLWHPLVFRIIRHLRDVARYRGTDEDDPRKIDYLNDSAEMHLRTLIEATASGLLGGTWSLKPPGWLLKPPPGRPGRKKDEYIETMELELRDEADYLKKSLQAGLLRSDKQESEDQQIHRVSALVKQVWKQSSLGREIAPRPQVLGISVDDMEIRYKEVPPPPAERVINWVRDAFARRTETGRSIESRLTWKMLAYRYELREDQVRGILDAVRKLFPRK